MTQTFRDAIQEKIPEDLHPFLIYSYDVVGDIAIIIIHDELLHYKGIIGKTLRETQPHLQVVARREDIYGGEYRILPLEIIAGEHRTITEVKESGLRLQVDLARCYYSVRSGAERLRIARQVQDGESVLVAFSGIGPFPLVIGAHSGAVRVVGVEKNPEAHRFAEINHGLNNRRFKKKKTLSHVIFIAQDFHHWLGEAENTAWDRIIMPLPKDAMSFVEETLPKLKVGGWLHLYEMCNKEDFFSAQQALQERIGASGRRAGLPALTTCGHCGVRSYRICLEVQVF